MPSRLLLTALLVAGCAFLAHARGIGGDFVYDDHRFVEQNAAIATLASPGRFFTDPTTASAAQGVEPDVWRPLRTLGFAVDRSLFGLDAAGWHAASVLLHVANAILVWVLLLRILPRSPVLRPEEPYRVLVAPTLGALAFAVHPATVESVAWVSSRGDLLAWTLVLLALEVLHAPGLLRTAFGVVLVALACLAKESAVVAFALLPLRDAALAAKDRPSRATTWARTGLLALVTVGYLVVRARVLPTPADLPLLAQTDLPEGGREAAARGMFAAALWYGKVLVLPFGFPFDRNVHTDPVPDTWTDPAVVAGMGLVASVLLAGGFALARGRRAEAFGWLGALLALVPVSQVVVPLKAFAAERFLYPALPCLAAAVTALAARTAVELGSPRRGMLRAAGVAAVLGLALLADGRTRSWRDDATLWSAVLRVEPMNPRAWEGVGFEHLRHGRIQEAERAFATYREFQPLDGKVRAQRAALFLRLHRDLTKETVTEEGFERSEAPRFLLALVMEESRAALEAWSRLGLTRARGDRVLLRATLEGWRTAAIEYGDLDQARRANDLLAADDVDGGGPVAYAQRRARALLAAEALAPAPDQDAARAVARRRVRAEVLRSAGIDPGRTDEAGRDDLLPVVSALLVERPGDHGLRRWRVTALLARAGSRSPSEAEADLVVLEDDLAVLLRASPNEPGLVRALEAVRARRGGR